MSEENRNPKNKPSSGPAPDHKVSAGKPLAEVHLVQEGNRIASHLIDHGAYLIGRVASCSIQLNDRSSSREHAILTFKAEGFTIEDLNSRNGTYLDGNLVRGTLHFQPAQKLRIGTTIIEVHPLSAGELTAAIPAKQAIRSNHGSKPAEATQVDSPKEKVANGRTLVQRHAITLTLGLLLIIALAIAGFVVSKQRSTIDSTKKDLNKLAGADAAYFKAAEKDISEYKFIDALKSIEGAIAAAPNNPAYHNLKGNILQSLLQLENAEKAYLETLRLDPNHKLAKENAALCAKILKDNHGRPKLLPLSIAELQEALRTQGRTAEAYALSRSGKDLLDTWQAVLVKAGITAPLTIDEKSKLLTLDLSNSSIETLLLIKDIPLTSLNLSNTAVTDLAPLKTMPLQRLNLHKTKITDLTPLINCRQLESLVLPETATNLNPLRKLPKLKLLSKTVAADGNPSQTAEEFWAENPESK